jgi:hypothetical protein
MDETIDFDDLKYEQTFSNKSYNHIVDHQLNRGDRTLNTIFLKQLVNDLEIYKQEGFLLPAGKFEKTNPKYISHFDAEVIVNSAFKKKYKSYGDFITDLEDKSKHDDMRKEFKPDPDNELVKLVYSLGMTFNEESQEERNKSADEMVNYDLKVASNLKKYLIANNIDF